MKNFILPFFAITILAHAQENNYSNAKTVDFPIATNNSIEIVKAAVTILETIFKNGYQYQKAGVMLTGLSNANEKTNLFSSEKDEKINSLMKSIDSTNHRYGRSTLSVASAGVQKKWNMKREYSSKIDTADFAFELRWIIWTINESHQPLKNVHVTVD